jgi:hypothetical protein
LAQLNLDREGLAGGADDDEDDERELEEVDELVLVPAENVRIVVVVCAAVTGFSC